MNNKRYYLHRKVKLFAKVKAHAKTVYLKENSELTDRQKEYLKKLQSLNYQIQYEL